jgi:hypothetical protein
MQSGDVSPWLRGGRESNRLDTRPNMYQICGGPAPPQDNFAHLNGVNNVNYAQPKADYLWCASSITVK